MEPRPVSSPQREIIPHAQTALITGASSGIGEAYARQLAQAGHPLLLVARRRERLETLAAELSARHGVKVALYSADLAEEQGLGELAAAISQGPALRYLIHCAGFGTRGHLVDLAPEKVLRMLRLHAEAGLRLTHATLPAMVEQGHGALILVSSLAAFFTKAHYTTYSATKAFLNRLAEGLHDELKGTGVSVQAVCAGLTRTEFMSTADFAGADIARVPDWAWMSPAQVAAESLAALGSKPPLFVPGWRNRLFLSTMQLPVAGRLLRLALDRTGIDF